MGAVFVILLMIAGIILVSVIAFGPALAMMILNNKWLILIYIPLIAIIKAVEAINLRNIKVMDDKWRIDKKFHNIWSAVYFSLILSIYAFLSITFNWSGPLEPYELYFYE